MGKWRQRALLSIVVAVICVVYAMIFIVTYWMFECCKESRCTF